MSNYNGLLYIFDKDENLLRILDNEAFESDIFFDDEFKKELNGEWTYKFSVDMSKTNDILLEYNKVGFFDVRGNFQLFTINDIEDNIGFEAIRTVTCVHDFYSLNEDIIENCKTTGVAKEVLSKALEESEYSVGIVSNTETQVKDISMITRLEAVNSIAETFGLDVYYRLVFDEATNKISKRYVDLIDELGTDTGLVFNFSLNLESIKRKINNNFFTALYGRGKKLKDDTYANFSDAVWRKGTNPANKPKGQLWIGDEEAIAKYGVRKGIYSNQNISIADTLLSRTWEKLQKVNKPKVNYEASVYELSSMLGYENYEINLGDRFNIIDEEYNINEKVRVIVEVESILDVTRKKVELGDPLAGITDGEDSEEDYIPEDGKTLYTWTAYADDATGNGITLNPQGKEYMGTANNQEVETPSLDDPSVYTWVKIKGDDGQDLENPDTLPNVPVLTTEGHFATVSISWTFENKDYYTYELYSSDVRGFEPTKDNMIFEGKASAFLHEVEPLQIWYYKCRAKNSHGRYTDFSEEAFAETMKISDGSKYFESLAIKDSLIANLNADKINAGKIKGTYIDARNLTVVDGNGKETFKVDSWGNLTIDAIGIKMDGNNLDLNQFVTIRDLATGGTTTINGSNITTGTVSGNRINGGVIEGAQLKTSNPTSYGGMWIRDNGMQLGQTAMMYSGTRFTIESPHNVGISTSSNIYLMPSSYVSIDGRCQADSFTLGSSGNDAYIRYSSFYSPWSSSYLSTYALKLNGAVIAGIGSGNVHFMSSSGGKTTLYANYNTMYNIPSITKKSVITALDKINSATVIDNKVIPNVTRQSQNIEEYVKIVDDKVEMNIDNTVCLLWGAIQELKQENEILRREISSLKGV